MLTNQLLHANKHSINIYSNPNFHFFIYTYRHESSLYIRGEIIPSPEDTTQGDPLAMAMFALATIPLVNKLSRDVKQC